MAKGKTSKKEKERRKKEELEELRKQKEQQENDKEVEERAKKEKQAQENAELECKRREIFRYQVVQREASRERISAAMASIAEIQRHRWDHKMWTKYMSCDGKPSLEDPRQLNAYISRWMEQTVSNPGAVLLQGDDAMELLDELEILAFEARHLPERLVKSCKQATLDFYQAIQAKLDEATLFILKETSLSTDPETGNSFFHGQNQSVQLAVWSNLACNQRYNGMEVTNLGIKFLVPRSVVASECAVRILLMSYDHYSPLCSGHAPMKVPIFPESGHLNEEQDLPKPLAKAESLEEGFVDFQQYFSLGPLLSLDLVAVPPQPHKVNDWIMTKAEEPQCLRYIPWRCDLDAAMADAMDSSKKDDQEEGESDQTQTLDECRRLLQVEWKLPEDLMWFDNPKLVRWNAENQIWTATDFHQVTYKEDQFTLTFGALTFGTFALLMPRFASLPYQSWDLIPQGKGQASLAITAMTGSVEIAVQGDKCSLVQVQSNEKTYLESLYGQPFTAYAILKKIQSVGVFLTPRKHDHLLTSHIKPKNDTFEANLYRQMALSLAVTGFSYSRWNSTVGPDKFVIRFQDESPLTSGKISQTIVLITETHATLLNITEVNQMFSEAASEHDPASADLWHLVEALGGDTMRTTLAEVDLSFIDTVYQLLAATRILCC